MKRILIKAHGIIPQKGGYIAGIGRTNVELISRFVGLNDDEIEFAIYCPTRHSIGFGHYGWNIPYHAYPFPHDLLLKSNFESFYRRNIFRYDLLHITSNIDNFSTKEDVVVTIHDLFMRNEGNAWLFEKCVKKSKAIVTCSEFTKHDILSKYPNIGADKVSVIPWGINHKLFYERETGVVASIRDKFNIKNKYFFACSCNNPRKNIDIVLEAFSKFSDNKDDVCLVLAWGNPPEHILQKYAKEIEKNKIVFLPYLTDEDLATLYTGAMASIYVSSFEGFGFPILESMACGTPVMTCQNSSLTEIGRDLAIYVKERDLDELAECMQAFYDEKIVVNSTELISYVSQYNWDNTAKMYVDFYKKALFD